ncbi:MAG: TetR/AcrR family transcriptional regulator [Chloroflexi bacterium]|nr:TetR/AcrR family transcriptional regulator [Chloroflexota bacterium]
MMNERSVTITEVMGMREKVKEQITQQRRQQILEAALRVFSQKGFGEATIPDIAQEAGVAVGTIYNYFGSKRDLLASLIGAYVVNERLLELLKRSGDVDNEEWLSGCVQDRLDFGFDNLGTFFFVFNEIQKDPDFRRTYAEGVFSPTMKLIEQRLESTIASGTDRPLNSAVVARAIVGMMIGFSLIYRIEGESSPLRDVSRQELALNLTDLMLRGFRGTEAGAAGHGCETASKEA